MSILSMSNAKNSEVGQTGLLYWATVTASCRARRRDGWRTPRVGRTEGRRTFSVARNLGPARGASATARTPRAGSAVSRGVAEHATLHLEAQTEAIAALALNRGRSVRLERRLRVLQRSPRRGALGSVGRKVREGAARSARRCADLGRVLSFRTTQPVIFDTRFSVPGQISDCCSVHSRSANSSASAIARLDLEGDVSELKTRQTVRMGHFHARLASSVRTSREHGRAD